MKRKAQETKKHPGFTLLSMFSGCGGLDLGFRRAGFSIVWANDFDADACATYRRNSNGLGQIIEEDIGKLAIPNVRGLDVLAGGFPCQAYSNAGNRKGIHDHRGNLYEYCIKFIEELQPKITIFENVRGFLSIPGRKKRLVEEIADRLVELGYYVQINLVNASDYGVPQNRLRTFMLGIRQRTGMPKFSFPPRAKGLDLSIGKAILDIPADAPNQGDLLRLNPQAVELGKMVPPGGSWKDIPYALLPDRLKYIHNNMRKYRWPNFYRRFHKDEIGGTVTAAFKPENAGVWHPIEDRVLSVREIARLQTFPDNFVFEARSVKAMYQMIGNAVPPQLAYQFAKAIKAALSGKTREAYPKRNYFEVRDSGRPVRPGDPEMVYEKPRTLSRLT